MTLTERVEILEATIETILSSLLYHKLLEDFEDEDVEEDEEED